MSLRSLQSIALERDVRSPTRTQPTGEEGELVEAPMRRTDMLVAAIPTEVLAPYTALIGLVVATIDPGESRRVALRWGIYVAGYVAIVTYMGVTYVRTRAASGRRFPVLETAAAVVAFGAWGLVMPGSPLSVGLSGDDLTIWTGILTIGGAFLVTLLANPLKQPVKA
jgi:hypothetical protein